MRHLPVVLVLFVAACASPSVDPRVAPKRPELPPLSFDLSLFGGGHLNSESLRGRYVVIKPFAAWCAPCRSELPRLITASKRFQGAPVSFVAVSFDEDKAAAQALVAELGVPFPVAYGDDGRFARALQFRSLSEMFLFGPDGEALIRYAYCNPDAVDDLVQRLTHLLAPPASSAQRAPNPAP